MNPIRIGPYLIDRRIGAGGMGNVYLAHHESSGAIVAVKELPAALARDDGFVQRFNREVEAMAKLNSPNIVKLIDSGADADTYYYAMEYVDGETITSRLRREKRFSWIEATEIARQICVGLKHAHDAGVIHRDLKPSNLMVTRDGVAKIADFGVAQVFAADRLTMTGGVIGTAEFMSPEQVKGARADKRSDLYSLGAVLYTMIVGQPPFMGATASDIMQKQRFGRFDPPKSFVAEIPSWLNDLICQMLEKDPDKRPPDAYVTAKRLQEIMKKVEIQDSQFPAASTDETRVVGLTAVPNVGPTFIRDLFSLDLETNQTTGTVSRLLNNVWFLWGVLGLIVVATLWIATRSTTVETDETLAARSEPDRIIQRARWRWKGGDPISALIQLDALESVISGDPSQKSNLKAIDHLRKGIRNQINAPDQRGFVEKAIARAETLPPDQAEQLAGIYHGIITLYGSDRRLDSYVAIARKKLETLEHQNATELRKNESNDTAEKAEQ